MKKLSLAIAFVNVLAIGMTIFLSFFLDLPFRSCVTNIILCLINFLLTLCFIQKKED